LGPADHSPDEKQCSDNCIVRYRQEINRLKSAIHLALANGDRTQLGTVRPILADAVNASEAR